MSTRDEPKTAPGKKKLFKRVHVWLEKATSGSLLGEQDPTRIYVTRFSIC